jgi:hypothetical protein
MLVSQLSGRMESFEQTINTAQILKTAAGNAQDERYLLFIMRARE